MKHVNKTDNFPDADFAQQANPGYLNIFRCKCPRCRLGNMFVEPNPYRLKNFMKMYDQCPVCEQPFELEVGFYYGSAYVSYILTVIISAMTFVAWWLTIGFSLQDARVFYWLIFNGIFLVLLQPWLMRFARTLWLSFFVRYNSNWKLQKPESPERLNESQKNAW